MSRRDPAPRGRAVPGPGLAVYMREEEIDRAIWAICRDLQAWGLVAYHTRDSRKSAPGFPDWVFVGRHGVMFRECKSQTGKLSPEQQIWRTALQAAGADIDVWRPVDHLQGRIARELADLAGPHRRPGGEQWPTADR